MIFKTIGTIGLSGGGSVVGTARDCAISPVAFVTRHKEMQGVATLGIDGCKPKQSFFQSFAQ